MPFPFLFVPLFDNGLNQFMDGMFASVFLFHYHADRAIPNSQKTKAKHDKNHIITDVIMRTHWSA